MRARTVAAMLLGALVVGCGGGAGGSSGSSSGSQSLATQVEFLAGTNCVASTNADVTYDYMVQGAVDRSFFWRCAADSPGERLMAHLKLATFDPAASCYRLRSEDQGPCQSAAPANSNSATLSLEIVDITGFQFFRVSNSGVIPELWTFGYRGTVRNTGTVPIGSTGTVLRLDSRDQGFQRIGNNTQGFIVMPGDVFQFNSPNAPLVEKYWGGPGIDAQIQVRYANGRLLDSLDISFLCSTTVCPD